MDFSSAELKEQSPGGIEVNRLQVPCKRDVRADNFVRGVQDFDFSIGGRYAWRPSKSYFRVGLTIKHFNEEKAEDGLLQPRSENDIAFADNPCAGLYDNIYVRAGNADVSSIVNYASQAHQVKTRLSKSRGWLKSIGRSAFGCAADFQDRVNQVASDGWDNEEYTLGNRGPIGTADATYTAVGSTGVVTGVNTFFLRYSVGDIFITPDGRYTITERNTDIEMTIDPVGFDDFSGDYTDSSIFSRSTSEQANTVYFMYVPPVGIFDHEGLLGSGEYRISMNPNSRFETAIVESLDLKQLGTEYSVTVEDVQFYPCIEKANAPATGVEKLFLTEQHIQSKKLSSGGGGASTSVLDFTVPPSTTSISVFFQDQKAGSMSTMPLTRFKIPDANDLLKSSEMSLTNVQLTYANVSKPSTNWTSSYTGSTNLMTQRYLDTQIDSGMFYSEGGAESFTEFRKRGLLLHYDFNRDADDRSTNLQAQFSFDRMNDTGNVLICAHFSRVVQISTQNGRVANVQTLSI
jgi:hypothetical protein